MCRLAAIKSETPVAPILALRMMQAMQKGHDNSGFAMVMQDLGGAFANFKRFPLPSMACTDEGLERADELMETLGFTPKFDYQPVVDYSLAADMELKKLMAPIGNPSLPIGRSDALVSLSKSVADRLQITYAC